jgi:hypothetical protein
MLKPLKFVYSIWTVVSFLLLTIPMMIGYLLLKLIPYQKQINGVYVINRTAIFIWSMWWVCAIKFVDLKILTNNKPMS